MIYLKAISTVGAALILVLLTATGAQADQKDPRLNLLFAKLAAPEIAAGEIRDAEQEIRDIWNNSGSATIDLLMQRGAQMMDAEKFDQAIAIFDHVIAIAPDFSEGWNRRATVYYLKDDYPRALKDLERTLLLEPRHFSALSGLGTIMTALGEDKRALSAFQMALKLNPHLSTIAEQARKLEPSVKGRGI